MVRNNYINTKTYYPKNRIIKFYIKWKLTTFKLLFSHTKYKFLKTTEMIQFYDRITDKKTLIDIYCATEIVINEEKQEYEIELYHEEYVKMKMY